MFKNKKEVSRMKTKSSIVLLTATLILFSGCSLKHSNKDMLIGAELSGQKEEMLQKIELNEDDSTNQAKLYKTSVIQIGKFIKSSSQVSQRAYRKSEAIGVPDATSEIYLIKSYCEKNEFVKKGEKLASYKKSKDGKEFTLTAPYDGFVVSNAKVNKEEPVLDATRLVTMAKLEDCVLSTIDMGQNFRYMQKVSVSAKVEGEDKEAEGEIISLPTNQMKYISVFDSAVNLELINPQKKDSKVKVYIEALTDEEIYKSNSSTVEVHLMELDDVILVKKSIVHIEDTKAYVYIMKDGQMKKQYVLLGANDNSNYCILDGLSEDMTVVEY